MKKYKKDGDVSYALGAAVTMELLCKRPDAARCVYVSPRSKVDAVLDKARELGLPVSESEKAFNILSPKENCYVIGEFGKFSRPIQKDRHHVVLVNPSNSGNLGTVMRDIAAFDRCDLAIIRPAVDAFDPKTVRASMGAIFDIAFETFDSFDGYMQSAGGREVLPFMLCGAPFAEHSFAKDKTYSLVFGNEATGLPQDFARFSPIRIEQSNKVDSLNLSTAVALALYRLYVS